MRSILPAFLTALFFSGSYVAAKFTTYELDPVTTTFLRYLVAFVLLNLLVAVRGKETLRLEWTDLAWIMLLGLTGIVGYHFFFFESLKYAVVADTAIINAASPIITALAAAWMLRERLTLLNYLGIITGFAGVVVLLVADRSNFLVHAEYATGHILMLVAVVCWVVYSLIIKKLVTRYSALGLTYYSTLAGLLILLGALPFVSPIPQLRQAGSDTIISLLYMGIAASGLGYFTYNLSIQKIGPTRTSGIVYSSAPILVAFLAWYFFGEFITWLTVLSTMLVAVGLILMIRWRPKETGRQST